MSQISDNARALLNTIRYAEGTAGERGYQTMFGGRTFDNLADHPRALQSSSGYDSDAAGAYQFLSTTWDGVARELGLRDFSPESQDLAALQLVRRRGVDPDAPLTEDALAKLAPEWASLPTREGKSYYGQPVKGHAELFEVYSGKRGSIAPGSSGSSQPSAPQVAQVAPIAVQPAQALTQIPLATGAGNINALGATGTGAMGTSAMAAAGIEPRKSSFAANTAHAALLSALDDADSLPAQPVTHASRGSAPGGSAATGSAAGGRKAGSKLRAFRDAILSSLG